MNTKLPPQQEYPKLIWYKVHREPPKPEQHEIIYQKHYNISIAQYKEMAPNADPRHIENLAKERAKNLTENECSMVSQLKRVVAETAKDERKLKEMIESCTNFKEWVRI